MGSSQSANQSGKERRNYIRIPYQAEVLMQCGNEEWSCNLLDISLKGMLVEPPENIELDFNNPCAIALFLGEGTSIHARVLITHITDEGFWGLKWQQVDIDSLKHLRRLLELNMPEPSLLSRELAELG